jgi:hypothetical protein
VDNELLTAARLYASAGLHVFPCGVGSKVPACRNGCLDATVDPQRISAWWGHWPYNVAIAMAPSRTFAIDIDGESGAAALQELQGRHGKLPDTLQTRTRRGCHYLFEAPDRPLRSSAGKIADGIDVRAGNAYVLAAPSSHPDGGRYERAGADTIADAPAWLVDLVAAQSGESGTPMPPSEWRELVAGGVCEGRRDTSVTKLVGYLLCRAVDPHIALELIRTWNTARCRPPLPDRDLVRIVRSIHSREQDRPQL